MKITSVAGLVALGLLSRVALSPSPAEAQWVQSHEQFYFPASHNWAFRDKYRVADRLFNAFDNAHNVLGESLWAFPENTPPERLERDEFDFIVDELLVKPPRLPLVEEAIGPSYARLVPEARLMFEWAHLLHRQIYDVYADPRVRDKEASVDELMRYYKSRPDLAFCTCPKSMVLMEGQPYSLAFREKYPKFNGLIWAYHWLQVGLYEPLILAGTEEERQTGVTAAVARFWSMLEDPPNNMPEVMPMAAAVAPEFTRRHPEAAAVFDNLHAMHDIISDILVSPVVPRDKKREAILEALARYRDETTEVMTVEEWVRMANEMGIDNMGGRAIAILPPPPERGGAAGMPHGPGTIQHPAGAIGPRHGAGEHGLQTGKPAGATGAVGKQEQPATDQRRQAPAPLRDRTQRRAPSPGPAAEPEDPHAPHRGPHD